MKKKVGTPLLIVAVFLAVAACIVAFIPHTPTAKAYNDYRFDVGKYDVTFDIADNCEIAVTEEITINYRGADSTGFLRDIPVNDGAQVKNVNVEGVSLIRGGKNVPFEVKIEDSDFVTVDIGDYSNKTGKSETYRLTYLYCISNKIVNTGLVPIVPIGTGWSCSLSNVSVKVLLPDGLQSIKMYVGRKGTIATSTAYVQHSENGRRVISATFANLDPYNGVTFDLNFAEGAVGAYFDFTPYYFLIAGLALLLIILLVKVMFFNKDTLTPIVNFEPPEGMDPLIMGKLIDNKVNPEDVTSLIFYWADKGYVKINLDDDDDPAIIKLQNLPENAANYEKTVFDRLFRSGDMVTASSLRYVFYRTVNSATEMVDKKAKGLFTKGSYTASIIFALLAALLPGIAVLLICLCTISYTFIYLMGFATAIPALFVNLFAQSAYYNRLRNRGKKNVGGMLLLCLITALLAWISTVFIPQAIIGFVPALLVCIASLAGTAAAVVITSRTKQYTAQLNDIVGFRNFILTAEKDRLEKLLEDDPQFYYHVLPYAQVLNVSDKWEDKFKDLTVEPPRWAVSSSFDRTLNFVIVNRMIRNSAVGLTRGMISRPSSSGSNGGSGGSFGGFSGGGFGGGGGRGR